MCCLIFNNVVPHITANSFSILDKAACLKVWEELLTSHYTPARLMQLLQTKNTEFLVEVQSRMSSDINTDCKPSHHISLDTQRQKRQDLSSAATDTRSCHMTSPRSEVGVGAGGSKAKQEVDVD